MARPVSKAATTDFGREIDAICARRGWRLSDFARHAGIAEGGSQVSRYRGGKPRPTLERLAEWESRPEIAPDMPRLRAALQRDIARAAQARTAQARWVAYPVLHLSPSRNLSRSCSRAYRRKPLRYRAFRAIRFLAHFPT